MAFYYNKTLRRIVFEGDMTGLDSITFSDGSTAVKSTELQSLRNENDSDVSNIVRREMNLKSIKVIKRSGDIASIILT
jgi:hypothetical protein